MTILATVALAFALLAPTQTPAAGSAAVQPATTAATQMADSSGVVSAPAEAPVRANSGLPQRAPVARTMAAYWPVFVAFTLVWAGIIAYALSFGRRSELLAAELERLAAEGQPRA